MKPAGRHPRHVLGERGLSPKKGWGQNFLCEPKVADRIAEGVARWSGATVLEIGAGLGALTRPLLGRTARVIAVERDPELVAALQEQLAAHAALQVVHADAMRCDWLALLGSAPSPRVVAGNLPYSITGKLLSRTIGIARSVDGAVFMVQREVGDRLRAAPGSRTYGALTVFAQAAFEVQRLFRVSAGAFFPRPKVESVVLRFVTRSEPRAEETEHFRQVVKTAFGGRRKMLRNAWRGLGGWSSAELQGHAAEAGIALDARAETLDCESFARMAERLRRYGAATD